MRMSKYQSVNMSKCQIDKHQTNQSKIQDDRWILNENQQQLFKSILISFDGKANVLNKKEKQRRLKKAFPALTSSDLNNCEDFFRTKAILTQKKKDIQIYYDREMKTLYMFAKQSFLEAVEEERINREKEEES